MTLRKNIFNESKKILKNIEENFTKIEEKIQNCENKIN